MFYYNRGRHEEAVAEYEHAVSLAPDNGRLLAEMDAVYMMARRFSDARDAFQRALEHDPDARTYVNLGTVYYLDHDYERAVDLFKKAVEEMPNPFRTWASLGEAYYWSRSSPEKANEAFAKAIDRLEADLSVNPEQPGNLARLAVCYAYLGRAEQALQTIEQALEKGPGDENVLARAAEVYALTGDDPQSDAVFKPRLMKIPKGKTKKLNVKNTIPKKEKYPYVLVVESKPPKIAVGNSLPEFWIEYWGFGETGAYSSAFCAASCRIVGPNPNSRIPR